ncbi:hypothetical protein R1sor_015583 [Riccia sorocarpa]|uniref:Tim44-like domain-containing protein n=1 Tax=Riccia sorocarpa TaxID=122646 RepID=A0ABD3HGJ8_9MARC
MSGSLRTALSRTGIVVRTQQQSWQQVNGRYRVYRFASAQPEQKESGTSTSYGEEVRQESHEERSSHFHSHSEKPEAGDDGNSRHDSSSNPAAAARAFVADKFQKGFTFASESATAGYKKLKNTNVVDAVKDSYNFLKEELNTPASRRKARKRAPTTGPVETSSETAIVPVVKKRTEWQKKLDELLDKARQHPVFRRLTSVKEHPVVAKSQELAEDLRERWETSDSPVVHKIQDINDSLFGETATAVAMKEIRQRDPSFSIPDFILELQEDIRPVLIAYLKGDYKVLKQKCSREVVDRCRAERTALESQGIFLDHKILHVSDIEVKETKLMGHTPIIIVAFQTQQIYCARDKLGNITQGAQDEIHTVYYAWAMQQMSPEDMEEGEIHPRWQLREMQQLGIQAII